MKLKTAAKLVFVNPVAMTTQGRKDIAKWLRSHATWFERHGKTYEKKFTARYRCRP